MHVSIYCYITFYISYSDRRQMVDFANVRENWRSIYWTLFICSKIQFNFDTFVFWMCASCKRGLWSTSVQRTHRTNTRHKHATYKNWSHKNTNDEWENMRKWLSDVVTWSTNRHISYSLFICFSCSIDNTIQYKWPPILPCIKYKIIRIDTVSTKMIRTNSSFCSHASLEIWYLIESMNVFFF